GAGLAAAAGLLLAAEGAADLRARGTDVHVGDAAVAAGGGEESLGRAHVEGEDGGGEALRHRVVERDRLVEALELEEVEDRRERLLAGDRHVGHRLDQGRLDEEAGPVEDLAALEDPPALLDRDLEGTAVVRDGVGVDER